MKLSGPSDLGEMLRVAKTREPSGVQRAGGVRSVGRDQSTEGVGEAVALSPAAKALSAEDADRAARLAEVRQALDNGSYQVDFERLADRIVEEEAAR